MISNGNTNSDNEKADSGRKGNGGNANKGIRSNKTARGSDSDKTVKANNKSNERTTTSSNKNNNDSTGTKISPPRKKRYNNNRNNRSGNQSKSAGNHNSTSAALNNTNHENSGVFEKFATWVSKAAGSTPAFIGAMLIVLGWGFSGPFFNFSETWQLVINTGTTIITFLMVFLIQKAQNKDSLAIQLKLNELVASHENSSNRLVDIENMTEDEMKVVQKYYRSLSELSKKEEKLQTSHSIEEAEDQHEIKSQRRSKRNNSKDRD